MIHGTRFGGIWWALAFEARCSSCTLLIWVLAFRTLQALCGIAACRSLVKCGCFCFLGVCFSWERTFFKGQPARLLFASGQGHRAGFQTPKAWVHSSTCTQNSYYHSVPVLSSPRIRHAARTLKRLPATAIPARSLRGFQQIPLHECKCVFIFYSIIPTYPYNILTVYPNGTYINPTRL